MSPQGPCSGDNVFSPACQYILHGTLENRDLVLILNEASRSLEINCDHLMDELVKGHFAGPAQQAFGFCRVPEEKAVLQHASARQTEREMSLQHTLLQQDGSTVSQP